MFSIETNGAIMSNFRVPIYCTGYWLVLKQLLYQITIIIPYSLILNKKNLSIASSPKKKKSHIVFFFNQNLIQLLSWREEEDIHGRNGRTKLQTSHGSSTFVPQCHIPSRAIANDNCGGKSPNWYIGSWALFEDMDTSEEEQMIRRGLECRIM